MEISVVANFIELLGTGSVAQVSVVFSSRVHCLLRLSLHGQKNSLQQQASRQRVKQPTD